MLDLQRIFRENIHLLDILSRGEEEEKKRNIKKNKILS